MLILKAKSDAHVERPRRESKMRTQDENRDPLK